MVPLIDIEPGMVVAGRYVVSTVDRRWLEDNPQAGAVCTALDAILDEPVLIHVADADGSTDVLEAARRVSILGDHRIAPTLDVGHSNGLDYIVSKRIAVTSLGQILPKTPMPIDAARALIGEIGTVLVTAARRGLFHMFLRPNTVGITSKGSVLVSGIGIDAALALGTGVIEPEDYTPTKASRQDALDLVRLFYAAMTGYWPADEAFNGIPPAERENSRIARAKSLNPEIPNGLDDFVSGVLTGSDPGPGSVAEVLGFVGEWDAELLRYVNRAPVPGNDALFEQSPRSFEEATRLPTPRATTIGADGSTTASEDQVKAALVRIGITRPGTRGLAAGVGGKTTGQYADRMQMREASSFPIGKDQLDTAAQENEWAEWEPEQTYSEYSGYADHEYDQNLTTPIMDRDAQDSDPDTQAIEIVPENIADDADDDNDTRVIMDDEDDGSWFLGGMFETNEQQREHQLREYERERRIARAKEEEARRRLAALEASSAVKRQEAHSSSPPKQVRRLSPDTADDSQSSSAGSGAAATGAAVAAAGGAAAAGAGVAAAGASNAGSTPSESATGGSGTSKKNRSAKARTAGSGSGAAENTAPSRAAVGAGAIASGSAASGSAGSGGSAGNAGSGAGGGSGNGNGGDRSKDDVRNSRKPFALLVLALVVVAAVVIGIVVANINSGGDESDKVVESSAPADSSQDGDKDKKDEPKADPPKIDSVHALDPEGDNEENDSSAEDVIPGTKGSWKTDRYNSAKFGNLKSGVGLAFELKDKTTVKEVKVTSSNSGGTFEIRDGTDPEDSKKVGEGEFDGEDSTTVKLDDDVDTDSLILWITELPAGEGGYRAVINTVEFK